MNVNVVLPSLSAVLCFVFAASVADQWLRRHQPYQLVWTIGLIWFGVAAGSEAIAGLTGWNELLYRTWYLFGAVWVAGWLGLGTVYLLARTRFGYAFAASLVLAGLFTFLTEQRYHYPGSGAAPLLYFTLFDDPWKTGSNESASITSKVAAICIFGLLVAVIIYGRYLPFLS